MRSFNLAYLVTHPIQYQAPLLRRLAQEPNINLTVFFCSDFSTRDHLDKEFGTRIEWDQPLLDGYRHEFLPCIGPNDTVDACRPFTYGLRSRLQKGKFDALWVHGYARVTNLIAMASAKSLGMKVFLRNEANLLSTPRGVAKRFAKRAFFAGLKSLCDAYLSIGRLNKEYYQSYAIPSEAIFPVPYAVDNQFFQQRCRDAAKDRESFRRKLEISDDRPVILYASKLTRRKRCIDLLNAYAKLAMRYSPQLLPYLVIVGDGECRDEVRSRVAQLGNTFIRLLGFQNQSELPKFYDICDVFVLPSIFEPWGLVINEAMNAGRAVITSDQVGCSADLVHHGKNGFLYKACDVDNLYQCLEKVLNTPGFTRQAGVESLKIINGWGFDEDIDGIQTALATTLGKNMT